MSTNHTHENQDTEWLDTVPASRLAGLLNSNIQPQDIDETAISRLRSSQRVGSIFKNILLSRLSKNAGVHNFQSQSLNSSQNPAIQVLIRSPSSAETIAKIIGAQIHASSLRQLITRAEIESMQQWLGRDIYRFALQHQQNMPLDVGLKKPQVSLSQTIQNNGTSVLFGWLQRQNEADRSKVELLHGDILTINALDKDLEEKIGTELSDSLIHEAVTAYKNLNT